MAIALKPPPTHPYSIEPGELLPPSIRRYDESLGATSKQQIICSELHRRKIEQQETQEFRNWIILERHHEEENRLYRGILWGILFTAVAVSTIALLLTLAGVYVPW